MRGLYLDDDALSQAVALLIDREPQEVERAVAASEHHVLGEFAPANSMGSGRWTRLGADNWSFNPTADPEFTWSLNRLWHLKDLGLAWRVTGDRRYLDTFKAHVDGWIATNPVPWDEPWEQATYFQRIGPWRLLETGLRAESLLLGRQVFAPALADDPAFLDRFDRTLVDHAEWLSNRLGSPDINHAMMHMLGLLAIAAALPEHPRAPYWRQLATERFSLCLLRQVGDDGVHAELTPGYHNVSVELFVKPCLIARRAGHPMPDWFRERLARMARFTAATLRADGWTSALSDWEPNDAGAVALAQLGLLLDDADLIGRGLATPGLLWLFGPDAWRRVADGPRSPSPATSIAFPETGYTVFRRPGETILFDAAPMGGPHGHADALGFEWTRGADSLIVDPGRYTYEEGAERRWFKGTRAHSTVEIDGQDQSVYASTQAWSEPTACCRTIRRQETPVLDFVEAEHDGYTRLADPVIHRRAFAFLRDLGALVIVDRLEGQGEHAFTARLMAAPATGFTVTTNDETISAEIALRDGRNALTVTTTASAGVPKAEAEPAWLSRRYAQKEETRALALSGRFHGSAVLVTVIQPHAPGEIPPQATIRLFDEAASIEIAFGEHHRVFTLTPQSATW